LMMPRYYECPVLIVSHFLISHLSLSFIQMLHFDLVSNQQVLQPVLLTFHLAPLLPLLGSATSDVQKMAVFWVVAPCSLVEVYHRFGGPSWIKHQGDRPDDGGSRDLRNVGKLLPDCMALQPRRQPSSYSPPWKPQILLSDVQFADELITCRSPTDLRAKRAINRNMWICQRVEI
jgi:hypothetical protein